jgi:hypothetical protein
MGVGVQFSAPHAHDMLGKAERPWCTLKDNAYAMLHTMYVRNSMCSCAVITLVYLRNRTYIRAVGPSGGVPITLLTSQTPDASKFRIFGCTVFAKVLDNLRRKLGEMAFRSVMVGYPHDAPGYHIYNPVTRRITTSVHVFFQEDTPGFGTRPTINFVIIAALDTDDTLDHSPQPHPLVPDTPDVDDALALREPDRPPCLGSHPIRYEELMAAYPVCPSMEAAAAGNSESTNGRSDAVASFSRS